MDYKKIEGLDRLEGLKKYLKLISNGLFTDVDFFVSFTGIWPELVIMVDVDWEKLLSNEEAKKMAYNFGMYLKQKYMDDVKTFLKLMNIDFHGKLSFQIMNWG